jgi:hypothetical protein
VSAEAELRADDSGDDSGGAEISCRGLEHGWIAAHGPSTASAQARGLLSVHPSPQQPLSWQTQTQQP